MPKYSINEKVQFNGKSHIITGYYNRTYVLRCQENNKELPVWISEPQIKREV